MSHQYHMQEIYKEAAVMYRELVEESSLDKQVCSCANNILENGVLDELLVVMKRFKYADRSAGCYYCCYYCHKTQVGALAKQRSTSEDLAILEQEYLDNTNKETAKAVMDAGGWQPNTLTGPEQWIPYSAMLTYSFPSEQMIRDFATFIYCKLNHPDKTE